MAEGGAAPPEEARHGPRGVSALVTIALAVVTFLAGLGVGAFVLAPPAVAAVPPCATPGAAGVNETVLLLGTNTPFPPFEVRTPAGGFEGFDIELIQEMVRRSQYACEWVDFRSFVPLLAAVSEGGVNIAVGAITMNGETGALRNASMDFTNPYYEADQGVLKRASDTAEYCGGDDDCTAAELNVTGLKVAVQEITTSQFWAEAELLNVDLTVLPEVTQVLQALSADSVDIVIIDKPAADGIAAAQPQFAVEGTIQTNELYGFAVTNNDPLGLIPKLNTALAAIRQDGTYDRLIDKWF
ncbi:MAG: ABC transporter substrate-binding protein [Methanobacteriota archaeon]